MGTSPSRAIDPGGYKHRSRARAAGRSVEVRDSRASTARFQGSFPVEPLASAPEADPWPASPYPGRPLEHPACQVDRTVSACRNTILIDFNAIVWNDDLPAPAPAPRVWTDPDCYPPVVTGRAAGAESKGSKLWRVEARNRGVTTAGRADG